MLVIIGTYCLFTAGSIFILKMLKKNKGYYYQSRHFTSVSGMLYRMKQNAAGLANICIMSTAVILIVSTTTCLYFGMDDLLRTRFPRNVQVTASGVTEEEITELEQLTADAAAQYGLSIQDNRGKITGTGIFMPRETRKPLPMIRMEALEVQWRFTVCLSTISTGLPGRISRLVRGDLL